MSEEVQEPLLSEPTLSPDPNSTVPPQLQQCALSMGQHGQGFSFKNRTVRKLSIGVGLALGFMLVEIVGGLLAHSLAIITDAAHLLADVSGFIMSLLAIYYSSKKSETGEYSYGYARMEVLAGLASVMSIIWVTSILLWEAVGRIRNPVDVDGKLMLILSIIGIAVNVVLILVLGMHGHGGHDHGSHNHHHGDDINLKGAFIHVIGDLIQSIGVAIGSALIWWHQGDPAWLIVDPLCTILFAILVLFSTSSLIRDITDILMERSPRKIHSSDLQSQLESIRGVVSIKDFHLWSLTPQVPLLAVHLHVGIESESRRILYEAQKIALTHGIDHSTFQIDIDDACV